MLNSNGHSFFFTNFVKESFRFSALPWGIWLLLCISTGSLAQARFLPCPRERWFGLLLLHLALYLFLESVARGICWPSSSSRPLLLITGCMASGGCRERASSTLFHLIQLCFHPSSLSAGGYLCLGPLPGGLPGPSPVTWWFCFMWEKLQGSRLGVVACSNKGVSLRPYFLCFTPAFRGPSWKRTCECGSPCVWGSEVL